MYYEVSNVYSRNTLSAIRLLNTILEDFLKECIILISVLKMILYAISFPFDFMGLDSLSEKEKDKTMNMVLKIPEFSKSVVLLRCASKKTQGAF